MMSISYKINNYISKVKGVTEYKSMYVKVKNQVCK